MSSEPISRVVIAGSGQAGVELAATLRQRGFEGSVIVLGDEPDLPYQRPPLSKEFLKSVEDAPLPLKGPAFYEGKDIDLRLGVTAKRIDRAAKELELSSGERLAYDHLVLATGARNRMPPVRGLAQEDVMELRTLAHARLLTGRLDELKHVTVLGGGFIGLEVASLLRARDVTVELVEAADRLMGRVLSHEMSDYFRGFHEGLGTRLRFKTFAEEMQRHGDGFKVRLSDGDVLETDAVMVAAGVLPNSEMASEAGLQVNNGVVVDERLLTEDPSISAIGDCAAHPNPYGIGMVRLESVQNAVDQAKCVAARLTGDDQPYDSLPWFWSNQASARLQIAGLSMGADEAVVRGDPAEGKFSVFLYRQGRLVTVESVNSAADHMVSRKLLSARLSVPKEVAADTSVDLKGLLPKPAVGSAA
ncbi:FAD-dependent oxidoreductase [Aquamicrobium sp. LC103]|uniref:NAD(P)/FAD-dependent oxidoreductase n=1 Tax=Aquamicrobium sp. LC103 TaxID=1120658 RepID=UPI00063E7444|nr:FAD-dependent oxidoreductase [Aquamicrobium sp. LC103]TKT80239.1 pyridine nucleotide-disulfide oxidoreductase [Aquamicrobium sp. LC103]